MKRQYIPWLIAAGFALLFVSTFLQKNSEKPKFLEKTGSSGIQTIATPQASPHFQPDKVKVTRIIDGDTIELADKTRVRYTGIDTPETGDCFGASATKANSNLVADKEITLENDVQLLDKYGRTLAYVWVDNLMVNEELVRRGYAKVSTYPPNVRYQDRFRKAEREASENSRGLWSPDACIKRTPKPEAGSQVESAQTNDCAIKGNISSSGEKIYHNPGQRYYEKTKIEESTGERWFCSESEAESAGWRKSKV